MTQVNIPNVGRLRDNIFLRNDGAIRAANNLNRRSYPGSTALSTSRSAQSLSRSTNIDKPVTSKTAFKQSISVNTFEKDRNQDILGGWFKF
ncbi:unnamed protein product [Bursaphelenchus okinawaensis]|uniref:Uncharacterized protein n=1 Tax=Bursaphelenchus okinawaensis TaxID=465554 RepID=A0A811LL56_9BILA|nr:unnamed protein product [Bursaphelenchus okinawaensis]CAG9123721.1 unnamed protein product [Bursaphelenchus okinawaensis]